MPSYRLEQPPNIRKKAPPSSDPISDFLSRDDSSIQSNGSHTPPRRRRRRSSPVPSSNRNNSVVFNGTFQKLLLLLVIVVIFDIIHIWSFFDDEGGGAGPEAGMHNLHERNRMESLADHLLAKLQLDKMSASVGDLSNGGIYRDGAKFKDMATDEKVQELELEVQLWKGRYDMAMKKLDKQHHHEVPQLSEKDQLSHLMYEGIDVEAVKEVIAQEEDDGNEAYDANATDIFEEGETFGVDAHILKILRAASVEIDEELASQLPTWEDVVSMYGPSPIIHGLETCIPYRQMVKPEDRMIGPAGMFNTGTNLLFELMKVNCDIKEARRRPRREPRQNGMRWQVPWGKHNPPSTHRFKNVAKAWGKGIKQDDFMPVVLIKDPYSWMGSQCRHKYTTFWGHDEQHCPNLIRWRVTDHDEPAEVLVKFALEMKRYESLLDMWNQWYMEWEEQTFPALHTRFEDLLFHGEEVVKTACECVGGVFTDNFEYVEDSAKPNSFGIHKGSNGLVKAMLQYGDPSKRLTGFTERDMKYASKAMNVELMEHYGYVPPPSEVEAEVEQY